MQVVDIKRLAKTKTERRTIIDKKPHFYVLNAIVNKLLKIIFSLVTKGQMFDSDFIRKDPRVIKDN